LRISVFVVFAMLSSWTLAGRSGSNHDLERREVRALAAQLLAGASPLAAVRVVSERVAVAALALAFRDDEAGVLAVVVDPLQLEPAVDEQPERFALRGVRAGRDRRVLRALLALALEPAGDRLLEVFLVFGVDVELGGDRLERRLGDREPCP